MLNASILVLEKMLKFLNYPWYFLIKIYLNVHLRIFFPKTYWYFGLHSTYFGPVVNSSMIIVDFEFKLVLKFVIYDVACSVSFFGYYWHELVLLSISTINQFIRYQVIPWFLPKFSVSTTNTFLIQKLFYDLLE